MTTSLALYYIAAYNHEANDWRRFLVSGVDVQTALADFDSFASDSGWRRAKYQYVCNTPEYVFMEL